MLHAAFVRGPLAHARIRAIRTDRALAAPGVVAILTGTDIRQHLRPKVCHVGEPFAVVVATDPYRAEDAVADEVIE
jgi:CO/xanthine dehydrogenase Mo-binding subunit